MAAVDEHRLGEQLVADGSAQAAAGEFLGRVDSCARQRRAATEKLKVARSEPDWRMARQ